MPSIGEFLVSLGFNVDDKKLDEFDGKIKDLTNNVLKLAGISLSAAGLNSLMNSAANTAVQIKNMTQEMGSSAKGAMEWASALRQVNPLVTVEQGLASYNKISEYLLRIKQGNGAFALSQLGVPVKDHMTEQDVIEGVRANYARASANLGPSLANKYVADIFGSVAAFKALRLSVEEYQATAARGVIPQDQIDEMEKYAVNVSTLGVEFDKVKFKIANDVAPTIITALHGMSDAMNQFMNASASDYKGKTLEEMQKKKGWLGVGLDALSIGAAKLWDGAKISAGLINIGGHMLFGAEGSEKPLEKDLLQYLGYAGPAGGAAGGTGSATRGMRNNNPGNIKYSPFAQRHGAVGQDANGFAIFPDQQRGVDAIPALMGIYGREGVDTISDIVQRYTRGDSPATQKAYMQRLMGTTGAGAGQHLNLSDPTVLAELVRGIISQENGGKSMGDLNVTQHIHSTASAKEVADESERRLQSTINTTFAQLNQGAQY